MGENASQNVILSGAKGFHLEEREAESLAPSLTLPLSP